VRAHPFSHTTDVDERFAEFDRFIAKVRAGAKVEALREAAEEWRKQNYALGEFDG